MNLEDRAFSMVVKYSRIFVWSSHTGCPPSCAHLRRIIVSQVWERVTSCLCWYVWIHNHYHNWYNMLTFCWLLSSSFYRFSSALQDTQDCVRVVCVFVSLKHNKYVICNMYPRDNSSAGRVVAVLPYCATLIRWCGIIMHIPSQPHQYW